MTTKADDQELVRQYALWGVRTWSSSPQNIKHHARRDLGQDVKIAETEAVAYRAVAPLFGSQGSDPVLIPMPCNAKGVSCAFFVPVPRSNGRTSFQLVVLAGAGQLAFRIEPADKESGWAHGYDHMQFCRTIGRRGAALPNAPKWLPESYPAFPIPGSSMVSRFLAMVIAMHGFSDIQVTHLLQNVFPSDAMLKQKYRDVIQRLFSADLAG